MKILSTFSSTCILHASVSWSWEAPTSLIAWLCMLAIIYAVTVTIMTSRVRGLGPIMVAKSGSPQTTYSCQKWSGVTELWFPGPPSKPWAIELCTTLMHAHMHAVYSLCSTADKCPSQIHVPWQQGIRNQWMNSHGSKSWHIWIKQLFWANGPHQCSADIKYCKQHCV